MIEHFTSAFCLTEVDSADDLLFLEIVFDDGLEVAVRFFFLGFWDIALEACEISVFGGIPNEILLNYRELHINLLNNFPFRVARSEVELKFGELWGLFSSSEWVLALGEIDVNLILGAAE